MNWIKENKFLFGFLLVALLGAIGGGVMVYFAYNDYDAVSQNFEKEAREYNRLRSLKPYPDEKNLAEYVKAKDAFASQIGELQKKLAALALPHEEVAPQDFQDRLNKTVVAVRDRAAKSSPVIKLPDKFYLDLNRYQAELPRDTASASALNRQMKAIEVVTNELIAAKIDALTLLKRELLPFESSSGPAPKATPNPKGGKAATVQTPAPLVVKNTLEISFTANQASAMKVLNDLSATKKQFFIVRALQIKNTAEKAPQRGTQEGAAPAPEAAPAAAPAPAAENPAPAPAPDAAAPAPAAPAAASTSAVPQYIVGEEKVIVTMRLEIVDFPTVAIK